MIKKYNQFVDSKANEEFTFSDTAQTPVRPDVRPGVKPEEEITPSKPSPFKRNRPSVEPQPKANLEMEMEDEEVEVDKYTHALRKLAEALGSEYNESDKFVMVDGKKVIFPPETEKYHVEGIKKPFATLEDVVSHFEGQDTKEIENRTEEASAEMDSIKDESFLDSGENQFESKSYKLKRFKK